MDRVPSPTAAPVEIPNVDCARFSGSHVVETTDGSFLQLGQASHLFHLSFLSGDHDDREPAPEPPPAGARPDIDSAMLEALRQATVRGDGLPGPTSVTAVCEGRLDIDTALLEALRQASVSDPEVRYG